MIVAGVIAALLFIPVTLWMMDDLSLTSPAARAPACGTSTSAR